MSRKIVFTMMVFSLLPAMAPAEIADSGPNGFTVKITASINAPAADVYKRLILNVGDWWSPLHTFSGDAHNLSIEEKPMGCFCEKLTNGGAVRHMEVLFYEPGKTLRMSGALGPMQVLAASGTLTFTFTPEQTGTKLEVIYAVIGYQPQGMAHWATPLNGVLTEQITRLKNYVETGNPAGSNKDEKKP